MPCFEVNIFEGETAFGLLFGKILDIKNVKAGGNLFVVHYDNLSREC